jgi:hypothetical protein
MSAEDKSQEKDPREAESEGTSPQESEQDNGNESLPPDPVDLTQPMKSDDEPPKLPPDVAIKGQGGKTSEPDSGGETRSGDTQSDEPESSGEDKDEG